MRWVSFFRDPAIWWRNRSDNSGVIALNSIAGESLGACLQFLQGKLAVTSTSGGPKTASQFAAALKRCSRRQDLETGRTLHRDAAEAGFLTNKYVAATLIIMYSKCGSMDLAREVFDTMVSKNAVTWNALILGYVENGQSALAMDLFTKMECEPSSVTFIAALKACGGLASKKESEKWLCLEKGASIHEQVKKHGFDCDIAVATTLIDMYRKCGCMQQARELFDRMATKDVVTWNSLIAGYAENGQSSVAVDLFSSMDCEPDSITYVAVLKACAALACAEEVCLQKQVCLQKGISIHSRVKLQGLNSNIVVATTLVDMYSKCGSMLKAREVFDRMVSKNVVTWNSLILGYVENGRSSVAMDLFNCMDCVPSSVTYIAAVKACGCLASEKESQKQVCLRRGIAIHKELKYRGFDSDRAVATTLVDMYSKCGSMDHAMETFEGMASKNVVAWNTLILGYVENGQSVRAMELFTSMDCKPSYVTYIAALKACRALACENESQKELCLQKGMAIHKQLRDHGFSSHRVVVNTLVGMYSKCGSMWHAREVFDRMATKDVVTWTSLILGYVESGASKVAMDLFTSMDCKADPVTYVAALKACAGLARENESDKQLWLEKGIAIHSEAAERGIQSDRFLMNTLIDLYSKCGSMYQAREVFDRLVAKDVVTWNSLILGYVENGESSLALDLFTSMDCEPDDFTYVAALKACTSLSALRAGQQIHAVISKVGLEQDGVVATALMDLYGKCGSMSRAQEVFNNIDSADLISWNTLIAGYSSFGDSAEVFRLTKQMQEDGLELNSITFISVLTSCSHAGLVDEGRLYFDSMSELGIAKTVEHYNCMVDLLGRANRLQEALALVKQMPIEANAVTWTTLLAACSKWKNVDIGKVAFDKLVAGDAQDSGAAYVLMRDIYGGFRDLEKEDDSLQVDSGA